ncbi:MAG TPA: riboflavin biosynthesis protein RibF [Coriobacteriia bacterium]|nr:riboflavin biosynthesis protein RibF [Coriobacteriia bacterium]
MRVVTWRPGSIALGRSIVALGVFDGVHLGHQELIASAKRDAARQGIPSVAVTFDRDPDQVLTPASAAPQLLTLPDKCHFLAEAGADIVLVVPFDAATAALSPGAFVTEVLLDAIAPCTLHVGVDFRFGHGAAGNADALSALGSAHGFSVVAHDLLSLAGSPVTSTRIRALIAAGDLQSAAGLLGRHHRVAGRVVHGRGAGTHDLGVPTANVRAVPHAAVPADGVYAGWATVADGPPFPAAISAGVPPSFPEATDNLEVHILDYSGDLYGCDLTIGFTARIRPLARFDSRDELAAAINDDIAAVRRARVL